MRRRHDEPGLNMDFRLNAKNQDLIERAKALALDVLAPRADLYDREARFPRENFVDLAREGFTRLTLPEALGGRALYEDPVSYAMVFYELAKGCINTAMTLHMHSTITHFLTILGTEEQAARYAAAVREGKIFGSHASEEIASGQWKRKLSTQARRDGGGYRINGHKYFCSMAGEADYYVIWCQLEDEEDLTKSLCFLVAPAGAPGFRIDKEWNAYAMRGTASHSLIIENVEVPARDLVGKGGEAFRPDIVPKFGFGYAAIYLGAGGAALDWVVDYAKRRVLQPDNLPIAAHPPIQRLIGEMKIALEGALLMVQRAGWILATLGAEAAVPPINEAKYAAAEAAAMITERAIKVAGGAGLLLDNPLQRFHREARAGLVMPPNTERCLQVCAQSYLKQSPGPSIF